MDIVLQAVIDALEKQLKGLDPNSQQAQEVKAQLQQFYAAGTGADTAKKNKASDEKINAQIKAKQQDINIAEAKGQDVTQLNKDVDALKKKLSTYTPGPSDSKVTSDGKPLPIPSGATINKKNVVDANGTIIGTTTDNKTYTPGFAKGALKPDTTGGAGAGAGGGTDKGTKGKFTLDPIKTAYVGYLKQTFATLEDKNQKAEIDNLLKQAKAGNWTASEFQSHLEGTSWWQTTLPTLRQFFLDSHDPRKASEFTQTLTNKMDSVKSKLESLGIQLQSTDPLTGKFVDNTKMLQGFAMDSIKNGWTTAQESEALAKRADVIFTGGGLVGDSLSQIKRQATMYGVMLDNNQLQDIQRGLLNPNDGRDVNYYLNDIKNQSYTNPMYKAFADVMQKNNTDLYSVTSSYRRQMADLLEVAPEQITWKDLMGKAVDSTTGAARTYADFTKQVKQDPLWQKTRNAKETYTSMGEDLMRMFGFIG